MTFWRTKGRGRGGGGGTRLPILSTFVGLVLLPVNYSEDSEYIHLLCELYMHTTLLRNRVGLYLWRHIFEDTWEPNHLYIFLF